MSTEGDLDKDFPSLKLGYEQVRDSLRDQAEIVRDYSNRAITLFSISIAVLGIGLPILFSRFVSRFTLFHHIPLVIFSVIPVAMFVFVYVYFWKVYKMRLFKEVADPNIVIDQYLELEPNKFYSESIQHIASAFNQNELIIKQKEKDLKILIALSLIEISTLVILTLLFFSFNIR